MRLWVSHFKTGKPSSLGLDNSRKGLWWKATEEGEPTAGRSAPGTATSLQLSHTGER